MGFMSEHMGTLPKMSDDQLLCHSMLWIMYVVISIKKAHML
jgi:hypothetical protein